MTYDEVGEWSGRAYPRGAVVVGYNGRDHSAVALRWAAAEAARRAAPLVVLFAANYPGMTVEPGPGLLRREAGALDAAYEVTARGVRDAVGRHPGLRVYGATEVTSPSRALIAASEDAALVVLGTRGYGRLVGALLSSVAFTIAARATCPVVVAEEESAGRRLGAEFPVVVGVDGSPESMFAVDFAASCAATAPAVLEIVTCTGGHQVESVTEGELRAVAHGIATSAVARVREAHPGLAVVTRVDDCPAEVTLLDASVDAGLLVVGTRGRGAFKAMLLGSVSHALIYGARCTVAVVGDGTAVDPEPPPQAR